VLFFIFQTLYSEYGLFLFRGKKSHKVESISISTQLGIENLGKFNEENFIIEAG